MDGKRTESLNKCVDGLFLRKNKAGLCRLRGDMIQIHGHLLVVNDFCINGKYKNDINL